ncbi:TPA: oligogalacturonide lyase, partial [Candidatus Bathyarchaeota archaeon]|nr:oligogalacturonide lyase [Candidatus Bathyarchaeota archaeon]
GVHIGYHGKYPDGRNFIGMIKYDNTEKLEFSLPYETGHTHSNDFHLIVGDGGTVIRLWRLCREGLEGPRILCEHRSSLHIQQAHPHPRFSPDGSQILYTSNVSGYGNLYLVEIPTFETLPKIDT